MAKTGLGRGLDAVIPKKYSQNGSRIAKQMDTSDDSFDLDDLDLDDEPVASPKKEKNTARKTGEKGSSAKTKGSAAVKKNQTSTKKMVQSESTEEISETAELPVEEGEGKKTSSLEDRSGVSSDGVLMLRITEVEPNRDQPRKLFNEDSLTELAESVKQYGIIQPLLVQKRDEYYEIIAGERRWRAARMAGLKEVPVIVRDYSDREILEVSLIENIQREDLNPIEEAKAYQRLIQDFELKQDEVAERVSKSRTAITNSMRLLKLDPRVQQMLVDEMISAGHARAILSIENPELQYQTASRVFDEKMSVRETEKLVKSLISPSKRKSSTPSTGEAILYIYQQMEERMQDALGTKVTLHRKSDQKGKIEIDYYSREELERIYDLLRALKQE